MKGYIVKKVMFVLGVADWLVQRVTFDILKVANLNKEEC
jgi:hypothetical protein